MTDPITDMLNRMRNAQAVGKAEVLVPFSTLKHGIAEILAKEHFIAEAKKIAKGKSKSLKVVLKYDHGVPAIEGLKRISKPGQRIYANAGGIKKVKGGFGIAIVSTPKGLMTGLQARKENVGGEILCEIW